MRGILKHGTTSGYRYYKCRCHDCTKANGDDGKMYRKKLYGKLFDHYGARCSCCGETEPCFLTIEHVSNGGNEHRRKHNGSWVSMVLEIIEQGYPDDYAIRCWNCNLGRERNAGICPHAI